MMPQPSARSSSTQTSSKRKLSPRPLTSRAPMLCSPHFPVAFVRAVVPTTITASTPNNPGARHMAALRGPFAVGCFLKWFFIFICEIVKETRGNRKPIGAERSHSSTSKRHRMTMRKIGAPGCFALMVFAE